MAEMITKLEKDKGGLQTMLRKHAVDVKQHDKRSKELRSTQSAIEAEVQKLHIREVKLKEGQEKLKLHREEYERKLGLLKKKQQTVDEFHRNLRQDKNTCDMRQMELQTKERQ